MWCVVTSLWEKESSFDADRIQAARGAGSHAGKVVTHRQLLKEVWGPLHVEESQYLRVYMRQLTAQSRGGPRSSLFLPTELGVGYRLRTE